LLFHALFILFLFPFDSRTNEEIKHSPRSIVQRFSKFHGCFTTPKYYYHPDSEEIAAF